MKRVIKKNRPVMASQVGRKRRIMAASELPEGTVLIVNSKAWVDITEDDWEKGALNHVNTWDFDVRGTYRSAQDLVNAIAKNSYVFSDKLEDYYIMDGSIRTSAEVDVDNDIPSNSQIEAWKRGEEQLFIADMYLFLEVGQESHEITDEEATMFGFQLY